MFLRAAARLLACTVLLTLSGCPQMFVYVPGGADSLLPAQNPETSTPGVAARPCFRTVSVLGGSAADIAGEAVVYRTDQLVSITCQTSQSIIYYTTDGTDPDPYAAGAHVFDPDRPIRTGGDGSNLVVTAIALAPQMYPSEVVHVAVSIDFLRASTPSISPPSGTRPADFQITMSSQDEGAEIWYTFSTVGPVPDPEPGSCQLYDRPIAVTVACTQAWVKAVAAVAQLKDSTVSHAEYLVQYPIYSVRYDANGATSGTVPVDGATYDTGEDVTVLGNTGDLARTGCSFGGWNTAADRSGTTRAPDDVFTMGSADVTLYAYWLSDGTTWTQRTMPSTRTWSAVFFGNGVFLATCSDSLVATSSDGATWAEHAIASPPPWGNMAYGDGVFAMVAGPSAVASTSPDGITWTQHAMPSAQSYGPVTYGNGTFVTVAADIAATSPDGITWTEHPMPSSQAWFALAYGNGTFVAVANVWGSIAATSPDGATWTQRALPGNQMWKAVTYGNGIFVALADGTATGATSTDGISWDMQSLGISNYWYSVTFGNGTFVAVSLYSGVVVTSPDGIGWTQRETLGSDNWCRVTFGNGVFVACTWDPGNFVASSP